MMKFETKPGSQPERLSDACVVYYHGNDWDGTPARQRYLMAALSRYVPVVYLDSTPEVRGRVTHAQPMEGVTVVKGLISGLLGLRGRGLERAMGLFARWHTGWLRRRYRRVLFWNAENALRPYRYLPHDALVYDCIDPCFSADPEELRAHDDREREALKSATLAFASADSLVERCRRHHPLVALLNNACAPEEYAPDLLAAAPRPAWWPQTDRPLAAYLGSVDWRFDFAAVERACRDHPEFQFIVAGMVHDSCRERAAALAALPNVTCPGRISVPEGRYLLAQCRVGLIPFTPGEMNDAINPVKLYAYALLGKLVVGTAIRELTQRPDVALTGDTPEAFCQAVAAAVSRADEPRTAAHLESFARANTWEARAAQAWETLGPLLTSAIQTRGEGSILSQSPSVSPL